MRVTGVKKATTQILILCLLISGFAVHAYSQDTIHVDADTIHVDADTIPVRLSDSIISAVEDANKGIALKDAMSSFKPNPKTAYICAAIFPGFGQVYNRQYWKLPIVYGGIMGFLYAITWNNKNYTDYKNAYFDIMTNAQEDPSGSNPDSWSQSWQNFIPSTADPKSYLLNTSFQGQLKSGKDFYRRYRDLSIMLSIAFYLICVADSYVDAQMFDFDITPDLSLNIVPEIRPQTMCGSRSIGIHISMTF